MLNKKTIYILPGNAPTLNAYDKWEQENQAGTDKPVKQAGIDLVAAYRALITSFVRCDVSSKIEDAADKSEY